MLEAMTNNLDYLYKTISNLDKRGKTLRSESSLVGQQPMIRIELKKDILVKLGLNHFHIKSILQSTKTKPLAFPMNQSSSLRRKPAAYGIPIKML